MAMTFYHVPMSTSSITECVLAELGLARQVVVLDMAAGDTRSPGFLAINPNGRVPVIVEDGAVIWESAAITLYLGETHGVALGLYPAPGPRRGQAMKWVVWANTMLAEAAGRLSAALPADAAGATLAESADYVPQGLRDPGAEAKARADVGACLAVLDGGLEGRDFLLGDYSLADTHLQGIVWWIGAMGMDLAGYAHLPGWLERCAARPALAALMAG